VLRHYDAENSGTTADSPENNQRAVKRMACYTFLRNPNGNRNVLYLNWNDGKWNWNVNWLDNDWNANHISPVLANLSFLLRFHGGGVLFCELTIPSSKHFAYLIKWC